MARITHLSNSKSIMILGTVVTCFVILWPRVFYPMLQGSLNGKKIKNTPAIHPRMRAAKESNTVPRQTSNHVLFQGNSPNLGQSVQNSIGFGGSMGIIMPLYTIVLSIFFIYAIFRFAGKDDDLTQKADFKSKIFEKNDIDPGKLLINLPHNEQGSCLKRLATNYVKCKQKLTSLQLRQAQGKEDVSTAINILLLDMLQLRDYLIELEAQRKENKPESHTCCSDESEDKEDNKLSSNVLDEEEKAESATLADDLSQKLNIDGIIKAKEIDEELSSTENLSTECLEKQDEGPEENQGEEDDDSHDIPDKLKDSVSNNGPICHDSESLKFDDEE